MACLIGFVVGSGLVIVSRYYDSRLNYLKTTKPFDPSSTGPSYLYLKPSMLNLLEVEKVKLLTKETIVRRRTFDTSFSVTGSHVKLVEQYRFVRSMVEYARSSNPDLKLDSVMFILHNKYQTKVCTSEPYTIDGSMSINANVNMNATSFSSTIADNTYRDVVYGVPDDDTDYLVVGDYDENRFIANSNLDVVKNTSFNEYTRETKDTSHFYYLCGSGVLTASLLFGVIEMFVYFG